MNCGVGRLTKQRLFARKLDRSRAYGSGRSAPTKRHREGHRRLPVAILRAEHLLQRVAQLIADAVPAVQSHGVELRQAGVLRCQQLGLARPHRQTLADQVGPEFHGRSGRRLSVQCRRGLKGLRRRTKIVPSFGGKPSTLRSRSSRCTIAERA